MVGKLKLQLHRKHYLLAIGIVAVLVVATIAWISVSHPATIHSNKQAQARANHLKQQQATERAAAQKTLAHTQTPAQAKTQAKSRIEAKKVSLTHTVTGQISKQKNQIEIDSNHQIITTDQAKLIQTKLDEIKQFSDSLASKTPEQKLQAYAQEAHDLRQWAADNHVPYHYVDVLDV